MKEEKKKKQESVSFFSELGSFMKPYSLKYAASVAISIVAVLSGIMSYAFAGFIAAEFFSNQVSFESVLKYAILAGLCRILNSILINVSTWISHQAAYMTLADIRRAVTDKMLRLPMGYFEQNGSGRLKTVMVDHIEKMEKTLAHMLPELTANLLGPLLCIIWIFVLDWRLALCVLIWIMLGFSVTFGMMKGYEEKYEGQIKTFKAMNMSIAEYVNGIEVIKNFGRADECYRKYETSVYDHARYNTGWQKETLVYSALGMAIAPFSIFPVLIAGLIFYGNGTLEATVLFMVILLTFGIFGPLMNTMTYFDQLAAMGTDAKEIKDILDYPELKRGKGAVPENGSVSLKNVTFTYEKDLEPAVKNVSFKVPEGTMLALTGPSGSGKSTIAKLIAGFWDSDSGEILIGNKNISEYTQEELNRIIAYVDQDTFLFDESIMDNIRLGRPDASIEEVITAAKQAGCHDFIEKLPDGYMTRAGDAGKMLSGGERQRIAIARAMMKDAPVMILDEATSSTDPENEAEIQKALSKAAEGKTLIVIAHRLSTIVNAEQIAFVKNGEIETTGTHSELLEKSSEYAHMWQLGEVK